MALVMVIGLMPATALAETGVPGELNYTLEDGVLTISGSGAISASAFSGNTDISTVVIEEGVTAIGNYAFSGYSSLKTVEIPASVVAIGNYAFAGCSSLTTVVYDGTSEPAAERHVFSRTSVVTVYVPAGYEEKCFAGIEVRKEIPPATEDVKVTGVTLDATTVELKVGETAILTVTVAPDDATDKTVTWTSSDSSVATVDENGKVTAVGEGEATITVTTKEGGKTATCKVTVSKPTSPKKKTKKYDAVIKQAKHGDVEVDDDYAKRGQEITTTVTPDKGYELDELTIIDQYGDEVDYEKGKKENTYVFEMPKSDVTIEASFEKMDDAAGPEKEEPEVQKEKEIILKIDSRIILIDGEPLVYDAAPVIKESRTFLPIRVIAEELGADVAWNEAEQTATITKDDLEIVIYIGQPFATVNGEPVALDAPAFIENGRTYLPLRFVAENLGAEVIWAGAAQTVTITLSR